MLISYVCTFCTPPPPPKKKEKKRKKKKKYHHTKHEMEHQLSSRWYLCARKSPYALHNVCHRFSQRCLWNGSSGCLIDDGLILVLSRKITERFLFRNLPPRGDRWCNVLGFVSAGCVSSASTLQIVRDANHLCWLLLPPDYLLGYFTRRQHVQGSTSTEFSKVDVVYRCRPVRVLVPRFGARSLNLRRMTCVVWLSPLEAKQQRACVTASISIVKLDVESA